MNKHFIITFYIQGEFYKQNTIIQDKCDWNWIEDTIKEILNMYPGYTEISSVKGSGGYRILFNEDIKKAVCYYYVITEVTGFTDANGSAISVGDKLVLKFIYESNDVEKIKDYLVVINPSGWPDEKYYLRSMYHTEHHYKYDENGHYIGIIPAIKDITGVNQEMMNDYIIYKDKN